MKNFLFICFAVLFTGISLQSCSKDKDNDLTPADQNPTEAEFHFACEVDSETFHSEDILAYAADFDTHINVYGISSLEAEEVIYIAIPKGFDENTYYFSDNVYAIVSVNQKSYSTLLDGGTGKVEVTKFDGSNIQGTFEFEAIDFDDPENSVVVKEGTFDVKIRL